MGRLLALLIVGAAGCDQLFKLDHIEMPPDSSGIDAPDGLGGFGTPVAISELDVGASFSDDPTLTADELEIVFTTIRPGTGSCDLYTSTRAAIGDTWAAPVPLPGLVNTDLCESGGELSPDGLTLWYTNGGDVFVATRPTRGDPFSAGTLDAQLSTTSVENGPSVAPDLLTMVLSVDTNASYQLFRATRASKTAPWSAPTAISELETQANDRSPHLSADGLALWFSYDPGVDADIFVARRTSVTDPFGQPVRVNELTTTEKEDDPWVSADGHRIYFSRYPTAGVGNIYTATR